MRYEVLQQLYCDYGTLRAPCIVISEVSHNRQIFDVTNDAGWQTGMICLSMSKV